MQYEHGLSYRSTYSRLSLLATVYALEVGLLVACSDFDRDRVMRLGWYFWYHILLVPILMADQNMHGIVTENIGFTAHMVIKLALTAAATIETAAFFVFACVEWSDQGNQVDRFLPIAVAILFVMFLTSTLVLFVLARSQYRWRGVSF